MVTAIMAGPPSPLLGRRRRRLSLPLLPQPAQTVGVDDPDHQLLRDLADYTMPFGKYQGVRLLQLPEAYLVWFQRQGWPPGRLGQLMATAYEMRLNGLERLLDPLRERPGRPFTARG